MAQQTRYIEFDGHHLAYRVGGRGPALVVLSLYRRREDMTQARVLSGTYQVFQVAPLGYGYSDRVPGYAGGRLAEQVLRVLDHHGVYRFVVWGYSAGGAMACCIARQTPRAIGLVCGGFSPEHLTPGTMRGLDRRLRPDHPSRSLWWWFNGLDWTSEFSAMSCARLFYWGGADRQMAEPLRRAQERLRFQGADFIELRGLDHRACNTPMALEGEVVPTVAEWLARLGRAW